MKFKLIVLFLLISLIAYSEIHGELEFGILIEEPEIGFSEIKLEYDFDIFFFDVVLYGGWLTWWEFNKGSITKSPYQDIYTIGSQLAYKNIYLDIEHFCSHPVKSDTKYLDFQRNDTLTSVSIGVKW